MSLRASFVSFPCPLVPCEVIFWVSHVMELKVCQIRQSSGRFWDFFGNLITTEVKLFEIQQLPDRLRDFANLILTEVKPSEIGQFPDRIWDEGNLILTEVKPSEIGQLPDRLWDEGNLIAHEPKPH